MLVHNYCPFTDITDQTNTLINENLIKIHSINIKFKSKSYTLSNIYILTNDQIYLPLLIINNYFVCGDLNVHYPVWLQSQNPDARSTHILNTLEALTILNQKYLFVRAPPLSVPTHHLAGCPKTFKRPFSYHYNPQYSKTNTKD